MIEMNKTWLISLILCLVAQSNDARSDYIDKFNNDVGLIDIIIVCGIAFAVLCLCFVGWVCYQSKKTKKLKANLANKGLGVQNGKLMVPEMSPDFEEAGGRTHTGAGSANITSDNGNKHENTTTTKDTNKAEEEEETSEQKRLKAEQDAKDMMIAIQLQNQEAAQIIEMQKVYEAQNEARKQSVLDPSKNMEQDNAPPSAFDVSNNQLDLATLAKNNNNKNNNNSKNNSDNQQNANDEILKQKRISEMDSGNVPEKPAYRPSLKVIDHTHNALLDNDGMANNMNSNNMNNINSMNNDGNMNEIDPFIIPPAEDLGDTFVPPPAMMDDEQDQQQEQAQILPNGTNTNQNINNNNANAEDIFDVNEFKAQPKQTEVEPQTQPVVSTPVKEVNKEILDDVSVSDGSDNENNVNNANNNENDENNDKIPNNVETIEDKIENAIIDAPIEAPIVDAPIDAPIIDAPVDAPIDMGMMNDDNISLSGDTDRNGINDAIVSDANPFQAAMAATAVISAANTATGPTAPAVSTQDTATTAANNVETVDNAAKADTTENNMEQKDEEEADDVSISSSADENEVDEDVTDGTEKKTEENETGKKTKKKKKKKRGFGKRVLADDAVNVPLRKISVDPTKPQEAENNENYADAIVRERVLSVNSTIRVLGMDKKPQSPKTSNVDTIDETQSTDAPIDAPIEAPVEAPIEPPTAAPVVAPTEKTNETTDATDTMNSTVAADTGDTGDATHRSLGTAVMKEDEIDKINNKDENEVAKDSAVINHRLLNYLKENDSDKEETNQTFENNENNNEDKSDDKKEEALSSPNESNNDSSWDVVDVDSDKSGKSPKSDKTGNKSEMTNNNEKKSNQGMNMDLDMLMQMGNENENENTNENNNEIAAARMRSGTDANAVNDDFVEISDSEESN